MPAPQAFARLSLAGFKSFRDAISVDLRPLTIAAGANSAGKSTLLQGMLLLKQTLEAPFDPGPILLDGPLVRVDDARKLLWRASPSEGADVFTIGFDLSDGTGVSSTFGTDPSGPVLDRTEYRFVNDNLGTVTAIPVTTARRVDQVPAIAERLALFGAVPSPFGANADRLVTDDEPRPRRNRCFIELPPPLGPSLNVSAWPGHPLHQLLHVPGLRGQPERAYRVASAPSDGSYPGSFTHYVATLLVAWHEAQDPRLDAVSRALAALHLTSHVTPSRRSHVEVELKVGRTPTGSHASKADPINIADVGFGVSQVLPVVVALVAAKPGQLVHIEQPELHLHPRAQVALATELIRAAQRGVRLVVETHSSVLLSALQVAVAEGVAGPDLIGLHWFARDSEGATQVTSAELDRVGTYGDWPVDFADIELDTARRLIEAAFVADKG